MTDYPYRPDHSDPGVRAMQADRRALISQIDRRPRYDTHEPPKEQTNE